MTYIFQADFTLSVLSPYTKACFLCYQVVFHVKDGSIRVNVCLLHKASKIIYGCTCQWQLSWIILLAWYDVMSRSFPPQWSFGIACNSYIVNKVTMLGTIHE